MPKRTDHINDWRRLQEKELFAKIQEGKKHLVLLEQDKLLGKLKNVHEITLQRKEIARMSTILDEKISSALAAK